MVLVQKNKITNHIKGNTSSIYRDNLQCRYCTTGEHLEEFEFTRTMRNNMDLKTEMEHMIP